MSLGCISACRRLKLLSEYRKRFEITFDELDSPQACISITVSQQKAEIPELYCIYCAVLLNAGLLILREQFS